MPFVFWWLTIIQFFEQRDLNEAPCVSENSGNTSQQYYAQAQASYGCRVGLVSVRNDIVHVKAPTVLPFPSRRTAEILPFERVE
jgi:hypothetical protein